MKEKRNQFNVSYGNIRVLELIPYMMQIKEYRDQFRKITLDYLLKKGKRLHSF